MLKSSQSFSAPLELLKNTGKTLNCAVPVLSEGPLYFQLSTIPAAGFFAYLANCVSYPLSTFYALLTDGPLVSRLVSRQSCLETLIFTGKTDGFAAKGVGFELVAIYALGLCCYVISKYPKSCLIHSAANSSENFDQCLRK
jgi:hypothetical protein